MRQSVTVAVSKLTTLMIVAALLVGCGKSTELLTKEDREEIRKHFAENASRDIELHYLKGLVLNDDIVLTNNSYHTLRNVRVTLLTPA